jgi:predicted nucleic acid-binding protein
LPSWIALKQGSGDPASEALSSLGSGERAAILLGLALRADLVLMDDRQGTRAALASGLEVVGTMGILQRAALRGMVDLSDAFDRLKRTNFRYRQEIMDRLLDETSRR